MCSLRPLNGNDASCQIQQNSANSAKFSCCAGKRARSARRRSAAPKQGCPHRPQGAKQACPRQKNDPRLLISRLTRKVRLGKPRPPQTRSVSRDGRTVMLPSPLAQPLSLRPRPICYLDGILSSTVELHSYNMRTCLHESLNQGPGGSIARQARTMVSYTTRHVYYATPRCLGPSHPDTNARCNALRPTTSTPRELKPKPLNFDSANLDPQHATRE